MHPLYHARLARQLAQPAPVQPERDQTEYGACSSPASPQNQLIQSSLKSSPAQPKSRLLQTTTPSNSRRALCRAARIAVLFCRLLAAVFPFGAAAQDDAVLGQIHHAAIVPDHGVPKLTINGQPVLPFIFFFNTSRSTEQTRHYLEPQLKAASENHVHLYSLDFVGWPWIEEQETAGRGFSCADELLDRFIKVDPKANFILRFYDTPPEGWKGGAYIPPDELILYGDGTKGPPSMASAYVWKHFQRSLRRMIGRYESTPYGPRILAYHACNSSEWFEPGYRESGPDSSPANQRAFRTWLRGQYPTQRALSDAWNKPGATFESAEVPRAEAGRFPIRGTPKIHAFYDARTGQDWVDFSRYSSEATTRRVMDIAKLIKEETNRRKLTQFFFGYTFDLPGSINGHLDIERLLRCPDIDLLVSPITYGDRAAGGAGGFMSAVDSITAHGKLWINEDDMRTGVMDRKYITDSSGQIAAINTPAKDFSETSSLLQRNLGSLLMHRAGTWWMDLSAAGAFNDVRLWQMLDEKGATLYREIYAHPTPYRPEVAVIIDPRALYHVRSDWDLPANALGALRNASGKTGVQTGYYFLSDFIGGIVPPCKAYLFANAFCLTAPEIKAIRKRLDQERATAVWQYAPGYLGPDGPSTLQATELTGIKLVVNDGPLHSIGQGSLQGLQWGTEHHASPRLAVADKDAEPLGRYLSDKTISAARKKAGGHQSVFFGDVALGSEVLKAIYKEAGAHVWTQGDDVIQTDGTVLMVHSAEAGMSRISPPAGKKLVPIWGRLDGQDAQSTRWFRIVPD